MGEYVTTFSAENEIPGRQDAVLSCFECAYSYRLTVSGQRRKYLHRQKL
jgi:hypothetical protein